MARRGRKKVALRGDADHYFGGKRAQREDWPRREFDNNERDRAEGQYEAGGRDFDERLRNVDGRGRNG